MTRRFARLAWLAATCTYLLIILGAIVRITGSGLGCGEHWPLCNGRLLPPLDLPTLIEYGHRLVAAAGGGLLTGVAGDAWGVGEGGGGRGPGGAQAPPLLFPPRAGGDQGPNCASPPWEGGVRRADVARPSGGARGRHREAQPTAVDGDPAPRNGDALARDADSCGKADPGLAPGVSRGCGARSRVCHRAARRAHSQPGRGQRLSRIPAVQRPAHPSRELPAAHPLGAPAARLHVVRVRRVVGGERETAWGVVRGWSRRPASRGCGDDGAARASPTAPGRPRSGGRRRVGRAGCGGTLSRRTVRPSDRQTRISSSCGR